MIEGNGSVNKRRDVQKRKFHASDKDNESQIKG